jgi:uncharacterized protein (TIGR02118 family)
MVAPMVRLICLLKRREGMSVEAFHRYWREHHGPLVASTRSGSYVRRYVQLHQVHAPSAEATEPQFDGVTEQWFDSIDDYYASLAEPDYARIAEDLPKFLDVGRLAFVVVDDDGEVVLSGGAPQR